MWHEYLPQVQTHRLLPMHEPVVSTGTDMVHHAHVVVVLLLGMPALPDSFLHTGNGRRSGQKGYHVTNQEVADIFFKAFEHTLPAFQRYLDGTGGMCNISPDQKNILAATNIHFSGKPVNITCCADTALKQCMELVKPYAKQ